MTLGTQHMDIQDFHLEIRKLQFEYVYIIILLYILKNRTYLEFEGSRVEPSYGYSRYH